MPWITKIVSKEKQADGSLKVFAEFVKDAEIVKKEFNYSGVISKEDVMFHIDGTRRALDSQDAVYLSLATGDMPQTNNPPSMNTAKSIWMEKFQKLQRFAVLADLGIIVGNEPFVVDLKANLKNTFDKTYMD